MDQCEGQMDVFEVIADVHKHGLIAKALVPDVVVEGDFYDLQALSRYEPKQLLRDAARTAPPLWNRGSSPRP